MESERAGAEMLKRVIGLIDERGTQYGDPTDNLKDIAAVWDIYLKARPGGKTQVVSAVDQVWMMVATKLIRAAKSPMNFDHYDDVAGYAACGIECVLRAIDRRETYTQE